MRKLFRFLSVLRNLLRVAVGLVRYSVSGHTSPVAYQSLVGLFCQSGGISNDWLSRFISLRHPPYRLDGTGGVLGNLDSTVLDGITAELDEKGYHVFEQRLPSDMVDRLLRFALEQRCTVRAMSDGRSEPTPMSVDRYDRERPRGVRYDFSSADVIDNPDVQRLMADCSMLAVAQSYLRCQPIVDVMSMWWHTAFSKVPDKDAAQFWHFDMDRIKWLKFFIYLTDVKSDNGPHCFVDGSHRTGGIPDSLRRKGYVRLTDEEVEARYPSQRFISFIAPRGTVLAEDTRGLHKGRHVLHGDRLMLQLQFSNSLYGGTYERTRFSRILNPDLASMLSRYRRLYSNYAD